MLFQSYRDESLIYPVLMGSNSEINRFQESKFAPLGMLLKKLKMNSRLPRIHI